MCFNETPQLFSSFERRPGRQTGMRGMRPHPPPPLPPKSQNGPLDGIVKDLKWYKNNVVVVELTNSMNFQQFENYKFLSFSRGARPRTPLKPLQRVQSSRIRRDCPDFTWEPRIPTRLQPGQEYPHCVHRLSQANGQRNAFLLSYRNICYKMNKHRIWIQLNSESQSWWMTQELQNTIG